MSKAEVKFPAASGGTPYALDILDEGNLILSNPGDINFAGAGVTVTESPTGTALVTIPGASATAWGTITGTLSAQTDLQNALNTKFTNGGDSFGAAATIGTNDNFGLNLETNGITRMSISNSGQYTFGTVSAAASIVLPQTTGNTEFIINGSNTGAGIIFRNAAGTRTITISGVNLDLTANSGVFTFGNGTAGGLRFGLDGAQRISRLGSGFIQFDDTMTIASRSGPAITGDILLRPANETGIVTGQVYIIRQSRTLAPNYSAVLQIDSTVQGVLIPRMTEAQRNAIATPATGLSVFNTTNNSHDYYNGSAWVNIVSSSNFDGLNIAFGTTNGTKIGTATSQKLAFWNATPIIQPTTGIGTAVFVANTGNNVKDDSTFDGYTVSQVVKALRDIGILA